VRTEQNVGRVAEVICSQEGNPGSSRSRREIEHLTGISGSSVSADCQTLLAAWSVWTQEGTCTCCLILIVRNTLCAAKRYCVEDVCRMLTRYCVLMRKVVLFSHQLTPIRMIDCTRQQTRSQPYQANVLSKDTSTSVTACMMVSVAVSRSGKTQAHFVDKGTKIDGRYYRETFLHNSLSEIFVKNAATSSCFNSPDGTPSHRAKLTAEFLQQNVPNFIKPSV